MKWKFGGGLSSSSPPPPLPICRDNVLRTFWQEAPEQNLQSPPSIWGLRHHCNSFSCTRIIGISEERREFTFHCSWSEPLNCPPPYPLHLIQPPTTSELVVSSVIVKCCSIFCWRQTNRVNLMESAKAWWVEVGVYVGSTGNVSLKVAPISEK